MSCITRQNILKACYQLDQHKIPLRKINGKAVQDPKSTAARVDLCAWWLAELQGLDTDTWEKVITLMLAECKEYPDIEKLYELINRAGEAADAEVKAAATPCRSPRKTATKNKGVDKSLAQMFAFAKQGLWSEARQVVTDINATEEKLKAFAKLHYPAKYSTSWLEKNKAELRELLRDEERCQQCYSLHRCNSGGYHAVGLINKYGDIKIEFIECAKVVKHEEVH